MSFMMELREMWKGFWGASKFFLVVIGAEKWSNVI